MGHLVPSALRRHRQGAERFNYQYSEDELKVLVLRVRELASQTKQLHVLFNNCYEDKAVLNASQTALILD
ncbi:MAG: DUF72 domain-containing protein [Chloroflexi bacterium]|nr:DUF72 domain-containing protein [Chloroflexota bacterium]